MEESGLPAIKLEPTVSIHITGNHDIQLIKGIFIGNYCVTNNTDVITESLLKI